MQFTKHIQKNLPGKIAFRLRPFFIQAEKLSSNNEEEAYMLGIIILKASRENRIDEYSVELIRKAAEGHTASSFYFLENKPHFNNWNELSLLAVIFGSLGIIYGIIAVLSDFYVVNYNAAYMVRVIKGGGYMMLFGFVLFIGGLSKTIQERRRNKLLYTYAKVADTD